MVELTKKVVEALALPEGESERIVWDDELPGFASACAAEPTAQPPRPIAPSSVSEGSSAHPISEMSEK